MTNPEEERPRPDPELIELVGRALNIAMRGPLDHEVIGIAERVVLRISHEYPRNGLWCACLWWCDTAQARVPQLAKDKVAGAALAFEEARSGRRSYADDTVKPEAQWAGRFLLARCRDDRDTAHALFASTVDGWQMGARVMELLSMVAIAIERGSLHTGTAAELEIGGRRG